MAINKKQLTICLALLALLSGCTDRVGLAEQQMQDIRNQPAQPVKPPPTPEVVQEFNYSASQLRSPFMPPSLMLQANQVQQMQGVRPDVTRLKEPLEQFELNELTYKGTMVSSSGEVYGLVQRPDGGLPVSKWVIIWVKMRGVLQRLPQPKLT